MTTYQASTESVTEVAADLLVLPLFQGRKPGPGVREVSKALGIDLLEAARDAGIEGKPGETLVLPSLGAISARAVALVGVGPQRDAGSTQVRSAALKAARERGAHASIASTLPQVGTDTDASIRAFIEGALLGGWRFDVYRSKPPKTPPLGSLTALVERRTRATDSAVEAGRIYGEAGNWVRDLQATPAGDMLPSDIAAAAKAVAKESGLKCKVWNASELRKGGFGGILAVGAGSASPPVLIELEYRGGPETARPYALTGKGIAFDSGGLNLKKPSWMELMKEDMTGAAAVIATMRAVAQLGLRINVVAAIGSAENAISGSATRPGDVVTHRGGKTSEVTDTDAEGRVLLADVLAYLSESKPRVIVDCATLTGTGLGEDLWAGFSNDQSLMDALRKAGDEAGEPGWQFPLWKPYNRHNQSATADVRNVDWEHGADTLCAALFLEHFVDGVPWAHLDVGEVSFLEHERDEWAVGPTGSPARTLIRYLENQAKRR
jgi:leucyl aminopeptidase